MIDLGVIPGTSYSYATGINDSGEVVGTSVFVLTVGVPSNNNSAAFLYSGGQMIDLGHLGGSSIGEDSQAKGINSYGQVVGESHTPHGTYAFLWTPTTPHGTTGTMIDLGSLEGTYFAGDASNAYAINSMGQIVGETATSTGAGHAFLWTPTTPNGTTGTMIDLNTLIGLKDFTLYSATGINDQGQIVAQSSKGAVLLTPTNPTAALAQPASSTPPGTIAGPTSVPGSDTSVAPVLASPPSDSSSVGPTAASVSLWLSQPMAAPAGAASPAVPVAEAPPFVPPFTGIRPPAGHDTDSPQPAWTSTSAADQVFASLDTPQPFHLLGDDLALAGWGSDGLTPVPLRG
jgi:probable HAF family extracellular repeat protein